jgi:molybdate transport system permease protein
MLNPADASAILLSLKVAATATLLALPFGFGVAYLMAFVPFRGKVLAEAVVNLPLTLPPVVVGYFLLLLLGKKSPLRPLLDLLGIHLLFTWKAAVIASMVVGFPLLVRSIRVSMEEMDSGLIQASRTLGATWFDAMCSVVLPLSARGLVAGSSLFFARSLGEFGATIIVAGNIPGITQTIPLAIYDYTASPGDEAAAFGLCLVAVAISFGVLVLHEYLARHLRRED